MLKFVHTKNFKMPGNRQMLDIHLHKDENGNLVQKESWEESLVISAAEDSEPKVVKVPFTKTYTTCADEKTGKTRVLEQIDAQHFFRDEKRNMESPSSIKKPIPLSSISRLVTIKTFHTEKGKTFPQK